MAPLQSQRARLAFDDSTPLRVRLTLLFRDIMLKSVAGGNREPTPAIAALEILIGIPDAAIPRARRTGKIHYRQGDCFELRYLFAHVRRQIPATTQAMQYFVDRIA